MTLKQFSEKYGIKYNIVYTASYLVKPISTDLRDRDFPENELYKTVMKELRHRSLKHAQQCGELNAMVDKMRRVRVKELALRNAGKEETNGSQ